MYFLHLALRRARAYLALLAGVVLLASLLFHLAEGVPLGEALYFIVATVTTVGYGDVVPHTPAGRVVAGGAAVVGLVLIFGIGMGIVEEKVAQVTTGRWSLVRRRATEMSGHLIVCGYGRLGAVVVEQLRGEGVRDVVVIERDEEKAQRLVDHGVVAIPGDALEEEVLREAGLERARALVATFSDDAANVYLTLEALGVRPELRVIAAASTREAERALYRAGAASVISPTLVAGGMLARHALDLEGAPDKGAKENQGSV